MQYFRSRVLKFPADPSYARCMPKSDRCSLPWSREFEDPITLLDGRKLVTLEDAARYIQKLPKKEQDQPHWQTATLTLINTAEGRDFLFHANAAMLQAMHHGKPPPPAPRGKRSKRYRIVR
jgi:hypothetical protein